jgi:hypothetical protein
MGYFSISQIVRRRSFVIKYNNAYPCETFKAALPKIDNIERNFLTLSQNSGIGSCDMNWMRSEVQKWSRNTKETIQKALSQDDCLLYASTMRLTASNLFYHFANNPNHLISCAYNYDATSTVNLTLIKLLTESIF